MISTRGQYQTLTWNSQGFQQACPHWGWGRLLLKRSKELLLFVSFKIFKYFHYIYQVYVCLPAHLPACFTVAGVCVGQRTSFGSQSSPSTTYILGIEIRSSGLAVSTSPTEPSCCLYLCLLQYTESLV